MKHSTYVFIDKPKAEVWEFFRDTNNMDQWLDGFQRMEHLSGGLAEVGSTYKQYYSGPAGREVIFKEKVLEVEAERCFSSLMRNDMIEMRITTKFYPKDGGTEILSEAEVTFKNMAFRLFKRVLMQEVTKRQDKNFKTLKEILEMI